jgi:hypothetical protein
VDGWTGCKIRASWQTRPQKLKEDFVEIGKDVKRAWEVKCKKCGIGLIVFLLKTHKNVWAEVAQLNVWQINKSPFSSGRHRYHVYYKSKILKCTLTIN